MSDLPIVSAVFFDLGGTLFHHLPEAHTHDNLLSIVRALPGADQHSDARIIDTYREQRHSVETEALTSAFFMHRRLVAEAFLRTLSELGIPGQDAATAFCDRQAHSVTQRLELRDETRPTLQSLRSTGIRTAIVSNIDDDYIRPLLDRHGLHDLFDYWLSSEQARSCKPHSGIFTQALAAVGTPAENVLFVGDSHRHDVAGARRMGMLSALLTADQAEPAPSGADFEIGALDELLEIVSLAHARRG